MAAPDQPVALVTGANRGLGAEIARQLAEDQYHESLSKTEGYLERVGDLNSQFHRRIHDFAGSSRLVGALSSLIEAPLMMKTFTSYQDEDLIRTKVNMIPESVTEIRVVDIVGLDKQADGGTHVASTAEASGVRVVKTESKGKGNKRIRLEVTDG